LCGKKFENWHFLGKYIQLKHVPIRAVSAGDASSGPSSETPLLQTPCAESIDTKRKIKREAGNARKKRRKGGFTNKGRIAYRQQNGAGSLVTGNYRSCLPDATWNAAPDSLKLHGATYEGLMSCMPDEGDTTTASVDTYLYQFGLVLTPTPVSAEFLGVKGGAELALLQRVSGSALCCPAAYHVRQFRRRTRPAFRGV
jgi:hypothetical protein